MTDIIIHKHSIIASDVPAASEIDLGELAIQAADGHIYLKKTDGTINRVTMLPGGGTQQVLYKTGTGDYALGWGTISSTLMGGTLWSEVVAEVQRVFALVEGTASVLLSASATLTAGSTGPITVSVADSSYLTDGTSITGVLGTVYGTLSRSGTTYSFVSNQSYISDVTFATGTRFAAAFLNDTFNPLRIGSAEIEDDNGYTEASGYAYALTDSANRLAMGITTAGVVHIEKGEIGTLAVNSITAPGGSIDLDSVDTPMVNITEGGSIDGSVDYNDVYTLVEIDSADKISRAIRPSGQHYFPKADFDELTIQGQPVSADVRDQVSGDSTKGIDYDETTGVFSSPDGHANRIIVKWGDSISVDISNSTLLEQLESGRQMLTRSTGGIDNGSILARFGALPITGRVYWEVKTVTVVSSTDNTVTLSAGGTTDIEAGDYFYGSGQNVDTVITAVDAGANQITLSIDAGTLVTTADAYEIQRPKIEAGKQTKIHNLLPTTVHNQTSTGVLSHFHLKNLKGVPYPGSANLPRDFNRENNNTSSDWADVIAEHTADGFISTAPRVVVDTTVTSGGTAADATSIVVADASKIAPGHFIMAKGIPYGCRVWDVDYDTNTVKLAMDTTGAVTGNVRVYERVEFKPDTTADISGIGEVQLKHCINIFDFDEGTIPETFRPHWWPNQHHGPERFDFSRADHVAQCKAFVDTQNNPYGKYLITSYQIWGGIYEGQSDWDARRDRALWASEAFSENFYDLAREVWVKAESWYQANYLTLYQANWEKTFIQMDSGAIAGAPTSGTYSGGAELMDGDLWSDGGTLYVLLLTTGDATHDAAQEAMFGGTHTLPTTTGQGIWVTLTSYATLAGTGTLYSGWASGRSGVVGGVTYQGSAYDIARKSSPRIGKRDSAHSNAYGSRLLGYLIGQELLRRGW